jgi:hypothetical protein
MPELPLAIDCEAIATIADVDVDAPAPWLPARVWDRACSDRANPRRRAVVLVDGARFEVPATMQLIESVEVLAMPDLLRPAAEASGVTGLAVLPAGVILFCDPRRLAGPWP